jgi:hypothetical protein
LEEPALDITHLQLPTKFEVGFLKKHLSTQVIHSFIHRFIHPSIHSLIQANTYNNIALPRSNTPMTLLQKLSNDENYVKVKFGTTTVMMTAAAALSLRILNLQNCNYVHTKVPEHGFFMASALLSDDQLFHLAVWVKR